MFQSKAQAFLIFVELTLNFAFLKTIYFVLVKNAEISCLCLKNELSLCRNWRFQDKRTSGAELTIIIRKAQALRGILFKNISGRKPSFLLD